MKFRGGKHNNELGPSFHLFDFDKFVPSIERLPPEITSNGITVYPTFRYKGQDANAVDWKPWGYGEPLTLQAGTAPTYKNGSPLLGVSDDSVKFNAGGYYQAGNTGFADLSSEDYVVEYVGTHSGDPLRICSKGTYDLEDNSWSFYCGDSVNRIVFCLIKSKTSLSLTKTHSLNTDTNHYYIVFGNRSYDHASSSLSFLDGINFGLGANVVGWPTSSNTASFVIAAQSDGTVPFASSVVHLAMWKRQDWFVDGVSSFVDFASIASTRFAQLTGMYPKHSRGTALYVTSSHPSTATSSKLESTGTYSNYTIGSNWPRVCSTASVDGSIFTGYLAGANDILRYQGNDGNLGGTGNNGEGTICFEFIGSGSAAANKDLLSINKSGSAADNIKCYIDTSGYLNIDIKATGGSTGHVNNSVSVLDYKKHSVVVPFKNNDLRLILDGVESSTDTSVTIPTGLDRIEVGASESGSNQPETVLLKNIRIYPYFNSSIR